MLVFTVTVLSYLLFLVKPASSILVKAPTSKSSSEFFSFADNAERLKKNPLSDRAIKNDVSKLGYPTAVRFYNTALFNILRNESQILWGSQLTLDQTQGHFWEDKRTRWFDGNYSTMLNLYWLPLTGEKVPDSAMPRFLFTSLAIDLTTDYKNSNLIFPTFVPVFTKFYDRLKVSKSHVTFVVSITDPNTELYKFDDHQYVFPFSTIFKVNKKLENWRDARMLFASVAKKVDFTEDQSLEKLRSQVIGNISQSSTSSPSKFKRAAPQELISEWNCPLEWYNDTRYCDCDCGSLDPDCATHESPCALGMQCDANGACPPYPTWNCSLNLYGSGEVCDCSCGIWDPDCDNTSLPIANCNGKCEKGLLDVSYCVSIDPPPQWTCPKEFYKANDGCDCDCGTWDPDCDTDKVYTNCPPNYQCNRNTVKCEEIPNAPPLDWYCLNSEYNDSRICHCNCGAVDPDCDGIRPVNHCPYSTMKCQLGYCVGEFANSNKGTVLKIREAESHVVSKALSYSFGSFFNSTLSSLRSFISTLVSFNLP